MAWWKRVTLFILSCGLFLGCSFNNRQQVPQKLETPVVEKSNAKEQLTNLIDSFFNATRIWDFSTPFKLDSIGELVDQNDSSLQFYGFGNSYEKDAWLFSTKNRKQLNCFVKSSFLATTPPTTNLSYRVWRKMTNGRLLLDFSIEPHPILGWVFVVRKRAQE